MSKTLSPAGIVTNQPVEASHVSQSIEALTGTEAYDITISGSLTITGSTYLQKDNILSTPQSHVLSFNNTTGQIFKATTSSLFPIKSTFDVTDDVNGATMTSIENRVNTKLDSVGLDNLSKNIVLNNTLTSTNSWDNIVGATLTDGVFYLSKENYFAGQVISSLSYQSGDNLIFAAKMKSVASTDYFFKVTLLYNGGVVSSNQIFNNTDDSFLLDDGYYQLVKKITLTQNVDQINIEFKASTSGTQQYTNGEGVFAYNPYISSYTEGNEYFFTDNDYFPGNSILDSSRFSQTSSMLTPSGETSLKNNIFNDLKIYDTASLRINMLGDSYTALAYDDNRGYVYYAAQYLGLDKSTNFNNFGIGGTRMANNSNSTTDTFAMVNRYTSMPKSDALVILGGFNDNASPFSTWTEKLGSSSTKTDITTIWGAYCTIIEGVITLYPYANNNVLLLTYPYNQGDADKIALNSTIRDIASYYNLPLLDLEKDSGIVHGLNAALDRPSLTEGYTWTSERRISFVDGKTIWNITTNPTSDADNYSYIPDYIPVDNTLYKTINRSTNSNILQYKFNGGTSGTDADYDYIGYDLNSSVYEIGLDSECTHLRFSAKTIVTDFKFSIVDGEYVTDNVHLNLLGMRDKVAPLFTEKLKSILKRKSI